MGEGEGVVSERERKGKEEWVSCFFFQRSYILSHSSILIRSLYIHPVSLFPTLPLFSNGITSPPLILFFVFPYFHVSCHHICTLSHSSILIRIFKSPPSAFLSSYSSIFFFAATLFSTLSSFPSLLPPFLYSQSHSPI